MLTCRIRILAALLLPCLLGGCGGVRERDVLGAQYFPDPAFGGRRTAFVPRPGAYAPPPIAPGREAYPPGPF